MNDLWCLEIYVRHRRLWMFFHSFKKIHGPNHNYFRLTGPNRYIHRLARKAERKGLRFKIYEKRWSRSTDYRRQFFSANPGPYRCRYCHRRLKKEQVQVDHIIPVARAKSGQNRLLFALLGIKNVNDIKNLAASCPKCNQKKGSALGFWYTKAVLGKHPLYWLLRFLIKMSLILILIGLFCLYAGPHLPDGLFKAVVDTFALIIQQLIETAGHIK